MHFTLRSLWKQIFFDFGFRCFVARHSTKLAGYILFFNTLEEKVSQAEDPIAVVQDLYVKPKYRRLGIGRQLVARAIRVYKYLLLLFLRNFEKISV